MTFHALLSSVVLTSIACTLTSCGSSKKITNNERSVGQQLTDLEEARQQRIINDREYNRLKKAIIKRND